jgi:alcohol dehydrogenase, propanol-preferring
VERAMHMLGRMKAARIHAYREPLVVEDVPTPRPEPGEVVIRVLGAGFCHSDLHVIDGDLRVLPRMPLTLGHENAGRVSAIGHGVTSVKEGDAVVVFGGWGCGRCDYCVTGEDQLCAEPEWCGLSKWDGGYAEYLRVPRERFLIKTTLDPVRAAPLADAALTPYRAIKKALPFLQPDHAALLIGAGGLGQYGLKLLRLMSGTPVIAVDSSPTKRARALELGATLVFDPKDPDLVKKITEASKGGVSAAFDFVGSEETLATSIASTRTLGKVFQIGLAGGSARLKVLENSRFEVGFECTLWGTIKELREVVALVEDGRLTLNESELAPLDAINDVYARLKRGDVKGRVIITP